jgi:hypothetical protein
VEQIRVELTPEQKAAHAVYRVKYLVANMLPSDAEWVMYIDPDCLMLRNPEALFSSEADVLFSEEPWSTVRCGPNNAYLTDDKMEHCSHVAINAGAFAIRGAAFLEFVRRWSQTDESPAVRHNCAQDQPPFVRTILDWEGKTAPFRKPFEVCYPEYQDIRLSGLLAAGLLHFNGVQAPEKLRRMLGFYMMKYGESAVPFLTELL